MKFNGYSFPHPILGSGDDVEGKASVVQLKYDETTDKENYLLTIEYLLENQDLQQLLSDKKAQFLCEISCTGTLYRKSETSYSLIQNISISKNHVREKVELLFLLVSTEQISNYSNSKAHPDFEGYKFELDCGEVLAYIGETYFIAGIAYKKLMAASSFMEIISGENETGDFNIILESQKITIQLSKKDYEKYCFPRIVKNPDYGNIFHSSIALPALIHALYQLKIAQGDFGQFSWAKVILFRLDNDLKATQFEEQNIPKIAQQLLGMPVERMLDDLFNHVTTNPDNDN